ncbi:T9SS type A sorting domain-containing protein [Flavobacteriaceae bacterium]|nr:T9SS type A sorting domain-containing protein [Flavobacteriaceae bacterium]
MKKNYFLTLILTLFISGLSFGQIINEFEPNAAGTEPANISLELKGTPGTSFTGYFLSVESDGNNGLVDRSSDVSGTFDSNGLLNVTIPDLENPSFTVILCSENVAIGTDLDSNNDGTPDNSSVLGSVYDAIGVPDSSSDAATLYGADLGGVDFPYLGNEPEIVFRDGVTDDLYSKNTLAGSVVYDILGNDISVLGTFDIATTATTFGSVNPTYTLATGPVILTGNLSGNLSYESGSGPSTEGTFTVEGTNLTNDILLSSPSDFEISETSQGTFSSSISLSEGGTGSISETTIYVRLKASLAIDDYSGDITITSTGAVTKTISLSGSVYAPPSNSLVITGAYDGPLSGGTPKGIELYVVEDITDLSIYGISSVSNGGGSSAGFVEYNFPADAVIAGTYIYLATESTQFNTFFGIDPTYVNGVVSINGDDSIELYEGGAIIDTFGDVDTDGSGEAWDYLDGWAYRKDGTGPEGTTFTSTNWTYSGTGALVGQSDNASATTPFPIGTYSNATASTFNNTITGFNAYPNPVRGNTLTVTTSSTEAKTVNIFNVLGRKVFSQRFSSMNKIMDISGISSGVYIMKVSEGNNIATKKLIIE